MATVQWEKVPKHPGVFKREGARGTIYKLWFRDGTGRHVSRNFDRLKDAEHFLADVTIRRNTNNLPDTAAGKITLAEFAEHFMATSPHLRPKTRALYDMQLRIHILPRLGSRTLSSIKMPDVKRFEAEMIENGAKPPTVSGVHRLLHRLLAVAVEEGRVPANPVQGVKPPKVEDGEIDPPSLDEVQRIAAEVPPRYKTLVYFLAFTGARIGEATALRVKDVDLKAGTARIERNAPEVNGVKHPDQPTKTARGRRTVDMPEPLPAMLAEHLNTFSNRFDENALVFTDDHGKAILQSSFRRHTFRPAAKRAGVSPIPRVHDLRHAAASLMIEAGYSLVDVAEQLGQGAPTIAARYSHMLKAHRQTKVAALGALLTGGVS